ncbi:DUF2157 domain-containing protein [Rhizobium halophytocola]|uniref:Membrane protein n=1 Tax=Rhizobium halophytocola TaxID=735519 RepID=A0ABS4DW11_9HYPH|nr:DUF2157 domain-containing protein [Rhizobium halophytocola]MBP1849881.1 putative membrane protein [Rhizobium halophytocola]
MYRGRLKRDFERWSELGLIEPARAERLLEEYDSRENAFSIGAVLLVLAAILLSASLLLLIAAGWQDIPRSVKIGGIILLIWVFHIAAALARWKGARSLEASLLLLGAASFGGGIALVGQLYQISGDAVDALMVWLGVTFGSAVLMRSGALTGLASLLLWGLFLTYLGEADFEWSGRLPLIVLAIAFAMLPLIWWTGADRVRHMVYLLVVAYLGWLYALDSSPVLAAAYLAVGLAVFSLLSQRLMPLPGPIARAGAAPAFYALLIAVLGLALLHIDVYGVGGRALLASIAVVTVILVMTLAGRDNGAARFLAYGVFVVEVFYLSYETIGSMLGSSGFFLLSGVVMAALAFAVIRLEQMFAARAKAGEDAA